MSSLSVPHCMAANNKSPKSLGQDKSEKFIRRTRLKFSFVNYHGRFSTLFKNTLSSDFPAHCNLFNSVLTMLHGTQYNQKPREELSQHPNIRVDRFLTRGTPLKVAGLLRLTTKPKAHLGRNKSH